MPFLVFAAIALIGAAIHRHRDSQPRSAARTLEIFLVWWMVVAVGIAAIFGAMFHFFDGPKTADEIGFTNGDGGFQTEVGFADLAIGVLGVLCGRFRDGFLLAAVIAVSIPTSATPTATCTRPQSTTTTPPTTPASPSGPTSSPRWSRSASTRCGSGLRCASDESRSTSPSASRRLALLRRAFQPSGRLWCHASILTLRVVEATPLLRSVILIVTTSVPVPCSDSCLSALSGRIARI